MPVSKLASDFQHAAVVPTWRGLVTACIAGVLALTSAKGDALIGVLVSVTTIPAAAETAVGIATTDSSRITNGGGTLLLNLVGMLVAGAGTLALYHTRGIARMKVESDCRSAQK